LTVGELIAAGADGALVSIGGDMAMAGDPPQPEGWFVTVDGADRADGDVCTLVVNAGGVATSSTRSRRWTRAGRLHHHLIDPARQAQATTDLAAVSVIAGRGWLAEAHATAALLAGSDSVREYFRANDVGGIAITATGTVFTSDDLRSVELATSRSTA
jgi:thiamine biosynthesis lipoprotein